MKNLKFCVLCVFVTNIALATFITVAPATADDLTEPFWLISTRRAARCGQVDGTEQKIDFYRLQADKQWLTTDCDTFLQTCDPAVPTTIFIHGNRAGRNTAIRQGWRIYRQLKQEADGRPFRFVVWSWPSNRIRGRNRRDVRVKACYSDLQSYYLAEYLDRVGPDVRVNLIGYSFGARIITGALHMLAGGKVAGRGLIDQDSSNLSDLSEENDAEGPRFRAILVASAIDAGWLIPGRRNGLAVSQVDRILVTCNGCDPVLRWYPLMYGCRGPQAAGYVGAYCLGQSCEQIESLDVSCSVGRIHDFTCYMESAPLRRRLARYAFFEDAR